MIRKNGIMQIVGILIVIVMTGIFMGCKSGDSSEKPVSNELRVGYIDSDKLLFEFPPFKEFRKKTQEKDIELSKIVMGKKREEITKKDRQMFNSIISSFLKERTELKNQFVEKVREASTVVMEEKKLDIIINNATTSATIEYGGIDITEDVQAKMVELRRQKNTDTKEKKAKKVKEK